MARREDVEDSRQARADLGCETDPLSFPAEREAALRIEGEIAEAPRSSGTRASPYAPEHLAGRSPPPAEDRRSARTPAPPPPMVRPV